MRHVTYDMWREAGILSKSEVPSSYDVRVKVLKDIFTKDESVSELKSITNYVCICLFL